MFGFGMKKTDDTAAAPRSQSRCSTKSTPDRSRASKGKVVSRARSGKRDGGSSKTDHKTASRSRSKPTKKTQKDSSKSKGKSVDRSRAKPTKRSQKDLSKSKDKSVSRSRSKPTKKTGGKTGSSPGRARSSSVGGNGRGRKSSPSKESEKKKRPLTGYQVFVGDKLSDSTLSRVS